MSRILANTGYNPTFNTPRSPLAHEIIRRRFPAYWRRLWNPLDALAVWDPRIRFDLMHSFNKVPLTSKPWMVTFESVLPRAIGAGYALIRNPLRDRLLRSNCRHVIATSEYAVRRLQKYHDDWRHLDAVRQKLQVIPPNLEVQVSERVWAGEQMECIFVGNHFARKGGVGFIRTANRALRKNLPVRFHIVSALEYGPHVYTDSLDRNDYDADMKLLELPNVTLHGKLSNRDVLNLLKRCHLVFLPTIHDTYGYSALEGMSCGTPVVATDVCALSEVVREGENGFSIGMPQNDIGDWQYLSDRRSPNYWKHLNDAYERMADAGMSAIEECLNDPAKWHAMSRCGIACIRTRHDARATGQRLEQLYTEALQ